MDLIAFEDWLRYSEDILFDAVLDLSGALVFFFVVVVVVVVTPA